MSEQTQETPKDRWKHRRRHAYAAAIHYIFYVNVAPMYVTTTVYGMTIGPLSLLTGAIIGAYIGFATADHKWQKLG